MPVPSQIKAPSEAYIDYQKGLQLDEQTFDVTFNSFYESLLDEQKAGKVQADRKRTYNALLMAKWKRSFPKHVSDDTDPTDPFASNIVRVTGK